MPSSILRPGSAESGWPKNGDVRTSSTRTVDVHVAGLRRKLERDPREPRYILTLHGLGYKFVAAVA